MRVPVFLLIPLSACAAVPPPLSAQTLLSDGSNWMIENVAGQVPPSNTVASLSRQGNQITGDSGCNRYFGPMTSDNGTLRIGPVGLTRMACEAPVMAFETALMRAFEAVDGAQRTGDKVTLTSHGNPVIVLRPAT